MKRFPSPFGQVELTDERLQHILEFHPEIKKFQKLFSKVLADPKFIRRSKFDSKAYILYRPIASNKHLAIVIKTNKRNFILTAYLTNKFQHSQP